MSTVPQTKVLITGESSGAVRAVQSVTREMGAMHSASLRVAGAMQTLAGVGVVAGLAALTKQAIDNADALDELSQRTGIAAEDLSKLQYAANITGVSSEQLAKGLITLNAEIANAAAGNKESAAKFADLGISIRDTDGRVRGAMPVLRDLADAIAELPEGAQQTNAAISIFGAKVGKDFVLALNGGTEALDKFGQELEDLGGVISGDLAKSAGQFNENLDKLRKVSDAVGISIGNSIIPVLNTLLEKYLAFKKSGVTLADVVFGIAPENIAKSNAELVDITARKIAALEAQAKKYREANKEDNLDLLYEIERQKRLAKNFGSQSAIDSGLKEDQDNAAKRLTLQRKLQAELGNLENLRAEAAGKVNSKIRTDAKGLLDDQLKDAQRLQEALRSAWQATVDEAQKARDESKKLSQSALDIRDKGQQSASEARRSALSPEDQAYLNQREAQALLDEATLNALNAKLAASFKRTDNATKLADQATKDAERAARLIDKIADPETRARAIERVTEAQANAEEARAKIKEQEAATLDERAAAQAQSLQDLQNQIGEIEQKLRGLALEVDIAQAQGKIAEIKAQLDAIPDVTVKKVEIQVQRTGDTGSGDSASGSGGTGDAQLPGLARGGFTGAGGKYQPAGIVHRGEYVLPQEVVQQRGMLAFLERLRRQGLSALPGFADGGLVGRLSLPTLRTATPAAARAAAVFNFPGMGRYETSMNAYDFNRLQRDFARAALQKGGRR